MLITLGIIIVGIARIKHRASGYSNPILGTELVLFAQLFMGVMLITEELFFSKIAIEPYHAQGIEGVRGLAFYIFLLPILNVCPCSQAFLQWLCRKTLFLIEQIYDNKLLAIIVTSMIGVVAMLNWTGIATTMYASSLARFTLKTKIQFVFGLLVFFWGGKAFFGNN